MPRNKSIRFDDNNFLVDLPDANFTPVSELTGFEKENAIGIQRSKVYKTEGNFTIDATNNLLYINDGSDKTVTLTIADYVGGAALASHIQTQLNASSSSWTCTYSTTTYKFTISRSSGTDTLRFSETTTAVWDSIGYLASVNLSAAVAGVADEARIHTHEGFVIDFGTARNVKAFHCIGPLDEIFSISPSATIELMGNTVPNSWVSPPYTATIPHSSSGLHYYLDDADDPSATDFRYWFFRFKDRRNTAGPESFKIGNLFLGDFTTVTTTNVAPGLSRETTDVSEVLISESGVKFFKKITKQRTINGMSIGFIENSERVTLEALFQDLGIDTPFYLCIDPTTVVSLSLGEATVYGRFESAPVFPNQIRDLYAMSFNVTEAV